MVHTDDIAVHVGIVVRYTQNKFKQIVPYITPIDMLFKHSPGLFN